MADLLAFAPQVLVVCAYGQILRQNLLDAVMTIVVHPSLVPRWRGAAPVERALMAGETELGVTILKMTAGVDEGPIGAARRVSVPADADAGRAYELLAPPAVDGVLATLAAIADGSVAWREQAGAPTFAAKIGPDDRRIEWSRSAKAITDQIRALAPHIGAVTELLGVVRSFGAPPSAGGRCRRPAAGVWPSRPATAGWMCWSCSRRAAIG